MAYDAKVDVVLHHAGTVKLPDSSSIEVSVRSLNGNDPKVAVIRIGETKKGDKYYAPVTRMTEDVAKEVGKLIMAACAWINGGKNTRHPNATKTTTFSLGVKRKKKVSKTSAAVKTRSKPTQGRFEVDF